MTDAPDVMELLLARSAKIHRQFKKLQFEEGGPTEEQFCDMLRQLIRDTHVGEDSLVDALTFLTAKDRSRIKKDNAELMAALLQLVDEYEADNATLEELREGLRVACDAGITAAFARVMQERRP